MRVTCFHHATLLRYPMTMLSRTTDQVFFTTTIIPFRIQVWRAINLPCPT